MFSGVGEPPSGKEHLGHCSQMAVFTRIKAMDEVDLSGVGTPYEIVRIRSTMHGSLSPGNPTLARINCTIFFGVCVCVYAQSSHCILCAVLSRI